MEYKNGVLTGTPAEMREFIGNASVKQKPSLPSKAQTQPVKQVIHRRRHKRTAWTRQEDAHLQANWTISRKTDGRIKNRQIHHLNAQVAKQIGKSYAACYGRLSRHNLI